MWLYTLAFWVIAIIAFSTFNIFNNTLSSTWNIVKSLWSFEQNDLVKLKIDKKNVSWTYQLKNNIKDSELLNLTLSWSTNLTNETLWIWIVSTNLSDNLWNSEYNTLNFTEEDKSAPTLFLFSLNKLSQDTKWLTLIWTGTLIWSDKTVNTYVYRIFYKLNPTLSINNTWTQNLLSFNSITDQELNTVTFSNIITLSYINDWISISIDTSGCSSVCLYRINWGWFVNTPWTINKWDTVQLLMISNSNYNTINTLVLKLGLVPQNIPYLVTTKVQPVWWLWITLPDTVTLFFPEIQPSDQWVVYTWIKLQGDFAQTQTNGSNGWFVGVNLDSITSSNWGTISNIHVDSNWFIVFDFISPNIDNTMLNIKLTSSDNTDRNIQLFLHLNP